MKYEVPNKYMWNWILIRSSRSKIKLVQILEIKLNKVKIGGSGLAREVITLSTSEYYLFLGKVGWIVYRQDSAPGQDNPIS